MSTYSEKWHPEDRKNEGRRARRYTDDDRGLPTYQERIVELVQANKQSLDVDFIQLSRHQTALAIWAIDAPREMFDLFNDVACASIDEKFPNYRDNVHAEIFVRMTGLPVVEAVRNIRCAPHATLLRHTRETYMRSAWHTCHGVATCL